MPCRCPFNIFLFKVSFLYETSSPHPVSEEDNRLPTNDITQDGDEQPESSETATPHLPSAIPLTSPQPSYSHDQPFLLTEDRRQDLARNASIGRVGKRLQKPAKRSTRGLGLHWTKDGSLVKDSNLDGTPETPKMPANANTAAKGAIPAEVIEQPENLKCPVCGLEIRSNRFNFLAHLKRHEQVPKPYS